MLLGASKTPIITMNMRAKIGAPNEQKESLGVAV